MWIDEAVIAGWTPPVRSGRRGASYTYSDVVITAALMIKAVYHLPLRATQGLLTSLLPLLGLRLSIPHYSTLSRRQAHLEVVVGGNTPAKPGQVLHLVVDSTGCKVYGEGEWKVRQHGWSQRRTWRKLHLAVDESTGEIVAATLSTNSVSDAEVLPDLLAQVAEPITQVTGDGGYDQRACYRALRERQRAQQSPLRVVIPPRRGARLWSEPPPDSGAPDARAAPTGDARNATLRRIRETGREMWKAESGYHRRSLAETCMFRYKALLGAKLRARQLERQARESFVGCVVLNRMLALGRPQSYAL